VCTVGTWEKICSGTETTRTLRHGKPCSKLLIQNCWFENAGIAISKICREIQYIKTEFDIRDDSTGSRFAGVWWGHYKMNYLQRCDCVVELDYNTYKALRDPRLPSEYSWLFTRYFSLKLPVLDQRNSPSGALPHTFSTAKVRLRNTHTCAVASSTGSPRVSHQLG